MKRNNRIKSLAQLLKQSILEHSRQDIGWYLNYLEDLTSKDLSDPRVQNEVRHVTNIVVNRFEEMEEEQKEKERKKPIPIGFRMSKIIDRFKKLNISEPNAIFAALKIFDPIAIERKIRSYQEKAIAGLFADPDISPLIERLPQEDQTAMDMGAYGLEDIMHALFKLLEHEVESAGGDFSYTSEPKRQTS